MLMKRSFNFYILLGFLILSTSCDKEKEGQEIVPLTKNEKINTWIKEVMDEVYFWLDDMKTPIAKSSEPNQYFESLLFKPTDRFSRIFPDYQELIKNLQGISKEAGYEFTLARESNDNENVLAFITYIKKNTPAAEKNLKRGDIIAEINGQKLTLTNYQSLIGKINEPHSITYFRYNNSSKTYDKQAALDLNVIEVSENPNFLDTVYTIDNQKIGYVVYHFFAPGITGQPTVYDDQMDNVFAKFKAEGIQHLIVDFRYNGGGSESSAINLASLIAPGVTSSNIFSKTRYNRFIMSFEQYQNVTRSFKTKAQNLGATLKNNRVYILTTRRTASASELIINGLKPYMDVYLVGDLTVGKNVGSIAIEDKENPENKYGLLPIVVKIFNKDDKSDYDNGFKPDIQANEISQPFFYPLGDTNDLLLKLAINHILGKNNERLELVERNDVGSSLLRHVRNEKIIMDSDLMELIKK
jgi:carboxyl-terminal processing protease